MASGSKAKKKQHYSELHDIPRANIGEIKKQIQLSWKHNQHRGAFVVVGEAGVGKSQVVAQIAKEENARICDIRTAHYGLVGAGIPTMNNAPEGHFNLVVPSVFPREGERAIMLFEEINQGLTHAISMFFSLIEDRRMFNYELPNDAIVIALMNPATAQYAVSTIENNAALRRRLKWVYAIDSFREWYKHADSDLFHMSDERCLGGPHPCHPGVLSFFKTFPKSLYDHKARDANRQYSCPATTQTVSLDAYVMERDNVDISGEFALVRFAASIGIHMATQLTEHLKDATTSIRADQVLLDYKGSKKAISKLLQKSEHEKITELNINVLTYLFGVQPDVKKVAFNLVDYLMDLPNELRSALLSQLQQVAEDNSAGDYLFSLMKGVQKHKKWVKIHTALDTSHMNVQGKLIK